MKIDFANGCVANEPPASEGTFVLFSENVRWVNGRPETIDLASPLLDDVGQPLSVPLGGERVVTIWNDRELSIIAFDRDLHVYNHATKVMTVFNAPSAAPTGRWWFVSSEDSIICARSSLVGRVYVYSRSNQTLEILPNSPEGAIAGGVYNGVLILAGTTSFLGDLNPLTVRWSARRGDPSSTDQVNGPFGFEDWTPSDLNSAGELQIDQGITIVGGGTASYGFMVWTDKAGYRCVEDATLVLDLRPVGNRGLLANGTWCILDDFVWWYDNAKVLNVYDGGKPRQLHNPMHTASTERLNEDVTDAVLVPNQEFHEVLLHYTDYNDNRLQLVHNMAGGEWYGFRLDRMTSADRQGTRPGIGVTAAGALYAQSLNEVMDPAYLIPADYPTVLGTTSGDPPPGAAVAGDVETFDFLLSSNHVVNQNPERGGPRNLNVVFPTTYARPPNAVPLPQKDSITVQIESLDKAARDAELTHTDTKSFYVGEQGEDFRGGGRALRASVWGIGVSTHIRFGVMTIDELQSGRR